MVVDHTKTRRTKLPSNIQEQDCQVGILVKDNEKAKQKKSKLNNNDKLPIGIVILAGQYSAKDFNKEEGEV